MLLADETVSTGHNHPRAVNMGVIAFINYNLPIACMWGSFSVLLVHIEARLGVGREQSALGASALSLATALCAPLVGQFATRIPMRLIMLVGSLLTVAGYVMLALTSTFALYLVAFGLLLGPGMAVAVIMPATLVTRWFAVNRGKALGIVTTPALIGLIPLVANWMLRSHGLSATYMVLAALSGLCVIANLFVMDPPAIEATLAVDVHDEHAPSDKSAMTMAQLARSTRFWAMFLAYAASTTSSVVLGSHMAPMVSSWHLSAMVGATLLSIFFFSAIPGTIVFGWIADRLGAVLALVILVASTAVGWILLLLHPPFAMLVVLAALIGAGGAGVVPVLSLALSEAFGRESFSRGYGLANLAVLPFSVLCVPAAALVFARTGAYAGVILSMALFLVLTGLAALAAWRQHARVLVPAS